MFTNAETAYGIISTIAIIGARTLPRAKKLATRSAGSHMAMKDLCEHVTRCINVGDLGDDANLPFIKMIYGIGNIPPVMTRAVIEEGHFIVSYMGTETIGGNSVSRHIEGPTAGDIAHVQNLVTDLVSRYWNDLRIDLMYKSETVTFGSLREIFAKLSKVEDFPDFKDFYDAKWNLNEVAVTLSRSAGTYSTKSDFTTVSITRNIPMDLTSYALLKMAEKKAAPEPLVADSCVDILTATKQVPEVVPKSNMPDCVSDKTAVIKTIAKQLLRRATFIDILNLAAIATKDQVSNFFSAFPASVVKAWNDMPSGNNRAYSNIIDIYTAWQKDCLQSQIQELLHHMTNNKCLDLEANVLLYIKSLYRRDLAFFINRLSHVYGGKIEWIVPHFEFKDYFGVHSFKTDHVADITKDL